MACLLTVACPQSKFSENKPSTARVPKAASAMEQPLWTSLANRAGSVAGRGNTQGAATMAVLVIPQEIPQLAVISVEGGYSPCFLESYSKGFF